MLSLQLEILFLLYIMLVIPHSPQKVVAMLRDRCSSLMWTIHLCALFNFRCGHASRYYCKTLA